MYSLYELSVFAHQDGRERHIDGHNLTRGVYHKFHRTSEGAAMDLGQDSSAAKSQTDITHIS